MSLGVTVCVNGSVNSVTNSSWDRLRPPIDPKKDTEIGRMDEALFYEKYIVTFYCKIMF